MLLLDYIYIYYYIESIKKRKRKKSDFPVLSKIEVPRDVRNLKGPYTWHVQERMVSTLEQMQVPNGTGPGVRMI